MVKEEEEHKPKLGETLAELHDLREQHAKLRTAYAKVLVKRDRWLLVMDTRRSLSKRSYNYLSLASYSLKMS